MRLFAILVVLLIFCGCTSVEKNYVQSTRVLGMKIGVDANKIPTIYMGYIVTEQLVLNNDTKGEITLDGEGISLYGSADKLTKTLKIGAGVE